VFTRLRATFTLSETGGSDVALYLSGEGGHHEFPQLVKPSVAALVRGSLFYLSSIVDDGVNVQLDVASEVSVDVVGVCHDDSVEGVTVPEHVETELCGGDDEGWQVVQGSKKRKAVTFAVPEASNVFSSPIASRGKERLRMLEEVEDVVSERVSRYPKRVGAKSVVRLKKNYSPKKSVMESSSILFRGCG